MCIRDRPTGGAMKYFGIDSKEVDEEWVRNNVAFVPQESFLFRGTIRENLNYSQPEVTSLEEELASIGVLEWFDRYEKKLDQEVGERGGNISAGERQFVALLRAVLAKRKIIVFDEATANLDIESESSILDATEKLLAFQTSIVIAHRLETVLNAEKIIVMENGNLTGFNSHENLLKDNETYKDLFSAWNLVNES